MAPIVTSLATLINQFGIGAVTSAAGGGPAGITATGGVISDYSDSGTVYRAHIFTSTGTFSVSAVTGTGLVECLVVAGGGGGAPSPVSGPVAGGGGGGGGLIYKPAHPVTTVSYTITVGGGGAPSSLVGGFSAFDDDGASPFPASSLVAVGGGVGGRGPNVSAPNYGGSGGGGDDGVVGVPGIQATSPNPRGIPADSITYGFGSNGGQGQSSAPAYAGGGGGGAGDVGGNAAAQTPGTGGVGRQYLIAGPPSSTQPVGTPGPNPGGGYFAGGGGGGYRFGPVTAGSGGSGGGGAGNGGGSAATSGTSSTGGGGGGSGNGGAGGSGGSGIVVVRYQIGQLTAAAKATGGAISYYGGYTIHTFTSSGDFTVTDSSPVPISYVVVAGGGSGSGAPWGPAAEAGGGGGAGGVVTNIPGLMPTNQPSISIAPGAPNKITITIGGGGFGQNPADGRGIQGTQTTFVAPTAPLNITAAGGGFGGISHPGGSNSAENGGAGGSGGGGAESTGSSGPATPPGQGFGGGTGSGTAGSTENSGGGGGGAGGTGGNAPGNATGGAGGIGVRLPAIFQNPISTVGAPGPGGTAHWIGGGGGGGTTTPGPSGGVGGKGGGAGGPYAGGGDGGTEPGPSGGSSGRENTGGGGGSAEGRGYNGGSGIVLIAYPT